MNATVKDVMTTEVVVVRQDTSFKEMAATLRRYRVSALPVESGVVTMEGSPETAALGHALVRKARHVPGVVAVRDRLTYPDTYPVVTGPVF